MQNAELIDKYLSGTLSPEESAILAQKIVDDPPFAKELQDYQQTYDALKNRWLKQQIAQASQMAAGSGGASLLTNIKLWIGMGLVATASVVSVFIFNKKSQKQAKANELKITQTDSLKSQIQNNKITLDSASAFANKSSITVTENPANIPAVNPGKIQMAEITPAFSPENIVKKARRDDKLGNAGEERQGSGKGNESENIQAQIKKIAPKPETFLIDNTSDTLISCKRGTKVYFPANCFETKNGIANNNLTVKITEYISYQDFFSAGLTSQSHGKLLNTGGMLNIEIKNSGEIIKLKKDSSYTVWMPNINNKRDEDMQTFYGKTSDTGINWDLNPEYPETGISSSKKPNPKLAGAPFAIFEPIKHRSIGMDVKGGELVYKPAINCFIADKGVKWNRYIPLVYANDEAKKSLKNLYDTFNFFKEKTLTKMIEDEANATITIHLDSTGKVTEFNCVMDKKNLRKYNNDYREFVRSITPVDFSAYFNKEMIPEKFEIFLRPVYRQMDSLKFDETAEKESTLSIAEKNLINFNRLMCYNTGWINCDKFNNKATYQAWFKNPPENSQITIYFHKINSCMNVRSDVVSLPVDVPATIITVNNSGKESKMQISRIGTRQEVIELPAPESFDLKKITRELNQCQNDGKPLP